MRRRGETRVKFTPQMWKRWLKRLIVDKQTLHLREGIQEFRVLLARMDDMNRDGRE